MRRVDEGKDGMRGRGEAEEPPSPFCILKRVMLKRVMLKRVMLKPVMAHPARDSRAQPSRVAAAKVSNCFAAIAARMPAISA